MEEISLKNERWYSYFPERVHLGKNAIVRHGTILEAINGDVSVGENTVITQNCVIDGPTRIGVGCILGPGVVIITHNHGIEDTNKPMYCTPGPIKPIVIEDDCYIGARSIILQGVTIHSGTVIGAGSVVTKDIPSGVVAYGVPCKVRRKRGKKT